MLHSLKKTISGAISSIKDKVSPSLPEERIQGKYDKPNLKRVRQSQSQFLSESNLDQDIFGVPTKKRLKKNNEGLNNFLETNKGGDNKSDSTPKNLLSFKASQAVTSLAMAYTKDPQNFKNPLKLKKIEEAKVRIPSIALQRRKSLHGSISEDDSELLSCVTGKETISSSLQLSSDRVLNGAKGSGKVSLQEDTEGSMFSIWNRQKRKLYAAETVIRLEERDRYKKLLEEYTNASSAFSSNSVPESRLNKEMHERSQHLFEDDSYPRLRNAGAILDKFSKAFEVNSSTNSLLSSTAIASEADLLRTKARSFNGTDTTNINRSPESPLHEDANPLGNIWTARWRKILDEKEVDRRKRIQHEESKLRSLERKRKERESELLRKIEDRKNLDKKKVEPKLPPLTDEMCKLISYAWCAGNPQECLVDAFNVSITRHDMATLAQLNWLNDEIVNFYFNLLKERSKQPGQLKMHFFNSFFYPKLLKTGYAGVRRWTKKVDIFSVDMVVLPVHLGMHWCLAAIDMRKKQIAYYDSLKGNNAQCISALRKYISEEHKDKKKSPLNIDEWTECSPKDIPEQLNGCDCGVFTCKFAECLTKDSPMNFSQANMPYFRKRMVYEIMTKKLL
ncbi:sentrin-specific protease 1-like isoform X2 [Rhopilema esculentum]|uniref:sentrin-specific protease 1-like isoform X2 n=1 Tax=Rhopilema esculentum TaxID=499914 RepID=UPI0031DC8C1B